jgi:hypothetical protein
MQTNPLLEVRKAYRLLYDYQARILDLMTFIGQSYNLPFQKGYPKFNNGGKNNLKSSSWNWLEMYYYSFHFNNEANIAEENLYLSVFLLNDTGYFDKKLDNKDIYRSDVQNFVEAEDSKSKLIFVAGKKDWVWSEKIDMLGTDFTTNVKGQSENGNMIWKSYDVENFFTEENSLLQLKDFEKHCEANNIPLKLKEAVFS